MREIDVIAMKSKTGIRREVLEEIIEIAGKYNIRKVLLFGSRARGDYRERM